ncbi:hypothetical protein ACWD7F_14070 [Streptomyces sp. NPDC005122]
MDLSGRVFGADAGQLPLYVNGRLPATKARTGADRNATGPVRFGRRLRQGAYGEYADGRLSGRRPPPHRALPGRRPRR